MSKKIISLKLIVNTIFILFVLSVSIFIYFDIKNIKHTLQEMEKEKIISTLKTESSFISPLLKFGFNDDIKDELKKIKKFDSNIKYIEIFSPSFSYKIGTKNPKLKTIKWPVVYKYHKIGSLIIGYDTKNIIRNFISKYADKFSIYFLILFVFFYLLYLYLKNKISKINRLAQKVKNINFKKQKTIEIFDNTYEIQNITTAINKLLDQVNKFYLHQKKLLKKLILYNKQIETAQKLSEMFTWNYDCETQKFETQHKGTINTFGFENIDTFINSIYEKNLFLENIKEICKNKADFEMQLKIKNPQNKEMYFKVHAKFIRHKDKHLVIGTFINNTQDIKQQEKIEYLAYHDPLTGLINRSYFKERLEYLLKISKRNKNKFAVIFIDLDNFKFINDTFGHEAGDRLLIEISKRLLSIVRESDFIARIGGDEFVVVLNNIKNTDDIKTVMEKLQNTFKHPVEINSKNKVEVTYSAGIAIYPDDAINVKELLQFADIAMYESKKRGKNRYSFITKDLQNEMVEYFSIIDELKQALKKENELILYFQPKIDISRNKVVGVEALIRWNHPKKGLLTPYYFIDKAEKAGLIGAIDSYVLEQGIKTLQKWQNDTLLKNIAIAVNISANKFNESSFVNELKEKLQKYSINPKLLQIEITETLSMQNIARTITVLNEIKSLGVNIALDDFGTGYSSLNYLKKLPFDVLKIDQTFVKDLLEDKDDLIITKMIIEISKILKKENVAEGVENERILKIIKDLGVNIIQGYYFSKPLSEESLKEFIKNFEKNNQ